MDSGNGCFYPLVSWLFLSVAEGEIQSVANNESTRFFSNRGTCNEVRMRVVDVFSKELPGDSDEASRYIYYVETLANGDRVYLKHPAYLHNGFDFLVCVENINYAEPGYRMRNFPKHDDIANDLNEKKERDPQEYAKLYLLLKKVFDCEDVTYEEMKSLSFSCGLPAEHILKVIKWLFIEQNTRYWNYSGRNKTWGLVPEVEEVN